MSSANPVIIEHHALLCLIDASVDVTDTFLFVGPEHGQIGKFATHLIANHHLAGNVLSCNPKELEHNKAKFSAISAMTGHFGDVRYFQGVPFGSSREPESVSVFQFSKYFSVATTDPGLFSENDSAPAAQIQPFHRIPLTELVLPALPDSTNETTNAGMFVFVHHPGDEDDILEAILESDRMIKLVFIAAANTPPSARERLDQRLCDAGFHAVSLWSDILYVHPSLFALPHVERLIKILQTNQHICTVALKHRETILQAEQVIQRLMNTEGANNLRPYAVRKWYFCASERSIRNYFPLIQAAVQSCRKNTSLVPHCVYLGSAHPGITWLKNHGVVVLKHEPVFCDELKAAYGERYLRFVAHWLRVDIPLLEKTDPVVLYTDFDVLFLKHPTFTGPIPRYLAAVPEKNQDEFNTGVMLLNVANMAATHPFFIRALREHFTHTPQPSYRDLIIYNTYYNSTYEQLPIALNCSPEQRATEDPSILHFYGVKPKTIHEALAKKENTGDADQHMRIMKNPTAYAKALALFDRFRRMKDVAAPDQD